MHLADHVDSGDGESEEGIEVAEEEPSQNEKRVGGKAKAEASHLGMARKDGSLSLANQEELALKLLSRKYA